MLQPPGASSTRNKTYTTNRRKTQESPDDLIRQLQRNPPNKKCADCSSKLPQCVNLTMGTFVCISCAGIHRELNNRVKGIGHSSFTQEEVDKLKATDNDQVNAIWLARYNPSSDRMKAPQGNQDQQQIRAWIRRKYQDKAWYGGGTDQGQDAKQGQRPQQGPPPPQRRPGQQTQLPPQPQPTMVQMPAPNQAPQQDFFGGPTPAASSSTSASANDGWDAFGGSSNQAHDPFAQPLPQSQQTFANFGSPPPKQQQDPFAAAPQQQQQQNFANFGQSPPPQTHHDPFAQPQSAQQNFANFNTTPQQPQFGNVANLNQQQQQNGSIQQFGNFGNNTQQQSLGQTMMTGQLPPQIAGTTPQQQPGFAAFDQMKSQQQQQPLPPAPGANQQLTTMHPPQQQQQQQQQQQGFAAFDQMQSHQQQPPPTSGSNQQQPMMGAVPPQQHQQQQGFAAFDQMQSQQQPMMGAMPPQQLQQQQHQQQGFAAFDQMQSQQQQPPPTAGSNQQQPMMGAVPPQQQQQGFAAFDQMQSQQQQPPPTAGSNQQQPMMGAVPPQQQQQGFAAFDQMQSQQQQPPPHAVVGQQQPLTGAMPPQQQGFTAFDQLQSQPQSQVGGMPPHQQQRFGAFDQVQSQQEVGTMIGLQHHNQNQAAQQLLASNQQQSQMGGLQQTNSAPGSTQTTNASVNPTQNEDPMNAFAHLSVGNNANVATPAVPSQSNGDDNTKGSRFSADQVVCYKTNGDRCKAKVVKVHLDDALEPFYTIRLDFGKEKQTDDAHLEEINPMFEKLESALLSLSANDLAKVEAFISQFPKSTGPKPTEVSTPALASVPNTVAPRSPSGMSHVSLLTQPTSTQAVQTSGLVVPAMSSGGGFGSLPSPGPIPMNEHGQQNMGNNMLPPLPQLDVQPLPQQVQGMPSLQMRVPQSQGPAMQQQQIQPQQFVQQVMPQQHIQAQMTNQQMHHPAMSIPPQLGMVNGQQPQPGLPQHGQYGQNPGFMAQPHMPGQPMALHMEPNPVGSVPHPQQPPMSPQGNPFDMY